MPVGQLFKRLQETLLELVLVSAFQDFAHDFSPPSRAKGAVQMHRSLASSNNDQSLLFLKKDDDGHIGLAIPVLVEKAVVAAIAIPRAGDHAVRENAGSIASS